MHVDFQLSEAGPKTQVITATDRLAYLTPPAAADLLNGRRFPRDLKTIFERDVGNSFFPDMDNVSSVHLFHVGTGQFHAFFNGGQRP